MKMTVSGNLRKIKQVMDIVLYVFSLPLQVRMCRGYDYGLMDSKALADGTLRTL
jgi:hypothetical protein